MSFAAFFVSDLAAAERGPPIGHGHVSAFAGLEVGDLGRCSKRQLV